MFITSARLAGDHGFSLSVELAADTRPAVLGSARDWARRNGSHGNVFANIYCSLGSGVRSCILHYSIIEAGVPS